MLVDKKYYNQTLKVDNELFEYFVELYEKHSQIRTIRPMMRLMHLNDRTLSKYIKIYTFNKLSHKGLINII